MAINWQPLNLPRVADTHLPPLLISTAFKNGSYTIHLTDLMHIWSESLTHPAILRRSEEENTSIDPSDDDQLIILLEKIKLGIQGGVGTTLALSIESELGLRPTIKLDIEVDLPGGIAPLEWPVRLEPAPQSLLTSHLILPLLQAQHTRMREMVGLAELLKEKDHVIQKLMDKLEQQGTDLAHIFPQVAGKGGRKVERKRVEEKVRGLGPFQMEGWKRDFDGKNARDTAQLVENMFTGDDALALGIESSMSTAPGEENWWEHIKSSTISFSNGASASSTKVPSKPSLKRKASTKSNDDFQVQETPPQLASPRAISQNNALDDSTDDEDLNAAISQRSKIPDSFPPSEPAPLLPISPPRPTKRLGRIGAKKEIPAPEPPPASADNEDSTEDEEASPPPQHPPPKKRLASPSPEAAPPTKPKRGLGKIGGKKKEATPPPPSEPPREPSPPLAVRETPKPKKGKLGAIGGKRKEATPPPPVPELQPEISPQSPHNVPKGAKKKLGAIGGNKHKTTASQQSGSQVTAEEEIDVPGRGRSLKPKVEDKEKTPPPREASLERADRKRRELKQELEAKAKAPVKKKRKF